MVVLGLSLILAGHTWPQQAFAAPSVHRRLPHDAGAVGMGVQLSFYTFCKPGTSVPGARPGFLHGRTGAACA